MPLAVNAILFCWLAFAAVFAINHLRVKRRRRTPSSPVGEYHAPESMIGLALEGLALVIIAAFSRVWDPPLWLLYLSVAITGASVVFAAWSLRHLGMGWRVKAVVTADHELIVSGPYNVVRHPIYLALFGMTLGTGLLLTDWGMFAVALTVYLTGTEIRVRAEDRILHQRFGPAFDRYRERVPAYLPFH